MLNLHLVQKSFLTNESYFLYNILPFITYSVKIEFHSCMDIFIYKVMSVKIEYCFFSFVNHCSRDFYMATQGSNSNKIELKKYIYLQYIVFCCWRNRIKVTTICFSYLFLKQHIFFVIYMRSGNARNTYIHHNKNIIMYHSEGQLVWWKK